MIFPSFYPVNPVYPVEFLISDNVYFYFVKLGHIGIVDELCHFAFFNRPYT